MKFSVHVEAVFLVVIAVVAVVAAWLLLNTLSSSAKITKFSTRTSFFVVKDFYLRFFIFSFALKELHFFLSEEKLFFFVKAEKIVSFKTWRL